jgi:chemotaxis protein methyltransferase CheR
MEHDLAFDRGDFDRVRGLIYQRAGISLGDGKQAMVYSRLSRRLHDTGHGSFASHLQWLEHAPGEASGGEWQEFVNCLTTNLTSFFREDHHFVALVDDLRARQVRPAHLVQRGVDRGRTLFDRHGGGRSTRRQPRREDGRQRIDTQELARAKTGVYAQDCRGLTPPRVRPTRCCRSPRSPAN